MSDWDQLYDLEPLLHTPPTEATSKQHSYITCKPYKRYDSDVSSISSAEGTDDFDSPTWWDILDHEEEAIQRYKKFLRDQLRKEQSHIVKEVKPEDTVTRVEVARKSTSDSKAVTLPERSKENVDHTRIVEVMQDSHDLAGPVEFCFWSLNGQPCQCGKC
ncbi:hypothetical protein E4T43_07833 [Aureobasidium subglaciale]|nr:hypothetical protein E4T43_07833 [Aureobasidium subglaciale]